MKWMRSEWISEEKTKRQGANNKRSQIGTFNTNKGNLKNWNWNNFSLNYFRTQDCIEIIFYLDFFLFRWHLCYFYYAPLYVLNNAWHASLQHNVASVLFAFLSILISLTLVLKGWGGCNSILYGNWFIIFIIFLLLWASTGLFVLYLFQYVSYWKQIIIIFCMQFVKSCLCLKRNWRWCCYLWRWSVAWIFNWKRKRFIAFPNEFKNCKK